MYRPTDRPVIRPDTTLISLMQSLIISRQQKLGGFRCVCVNDANVFSDYDDTSRHFECDAVYIHPGACEESSVPRTTMTLAVILNVTPCIYIQALVREVLFLAL